MALEDFTLGEESGPIPLDGHESVRHALLTMTQQARRTLDIFTHQLDHRLYNHRDFTEALKVLATRSRHSLIRILIKDSTPLVKEGSLILPLAQRISSRIQIRKPPGEFAEVAEEFLVADRKGLVHRKLASRYEGEADFNDPMRCRLLLKFFDECWEKSGADPELRHLVI